jgi:hypothetical protein
MENALGKPNTDNSISLFFNLHFSTLKTKGSQTILETARKKKSTCDESKIFLTSLSLTLMSTILDKI